MDKKQAEEQLIHIVDNLKLTKAERDRLYLCIKTLKDGTDNARDTK